ncbi:hypothetical protein [Streptomyces sp. AB3(2024)]|uniref:hypothetical protein n=1 Tax=Streptomyces sp. AB3(2024) TaxID=3317321 RepID=UPI0035A3A3F3
MAEPGTPPVERSEQQPAATFEQAVEIGRTAPLGRGGRASRRHIEKAVRDKGLRIGKDLLERVKQALQAELDDAQADAA